MWSAEFWVAAAERAVKTVAQVLLTLWVVGDNGVFNLLEVEWGSALGVAAGAAVASLLTSVVSAPVGPADSPSLVGYTDQH